MKLNLVGTGGTGINAVHTFIKRLGEDYKGIAEIVPHYFDTGDANIKKKNLTDQAVIIQLPADESDKEARDGSGKKRTTHAAEIQRRVPELFGGIGFNDATVIVMSGGGGSGGVIGQYGMRHLLKENRMVIGIMINSYDDAQSRINCMDSVATLESICRTTGRPSILFLVDTSDIANFLNFSVVTPVPPRLAFLNAYIGMTNNEITEVEKDGCIAVASLFRNAVHKAPVDSEYSCHGIFDSDIISESIDSMHLVISVATVEEQFKAVQRRVFSDEERRKKQAKYESFAKPVSDGDDMIIR